MEEYGDISILNVEVNHKIYGVGTVVSQNANKITVVFPDAEKKLNFVINKNTVCVRLFLMTTKSLRRLHNMIC